MQQKIRRIAFEVYENNFEEKEILLAGILDSGLKLASQIGTEISKISDIQVKLVRIDVDKTAPTQSNIELNCSEKEIIGKAIVIVDDVLNTGRTVAHCLKPFLSVAVKKIETAFLVNRSHINFPISSKYTGYQVSTMLNDHIEVLLEGNDAGVYLH